MASESCRILGVRVDALPKAVVRRRVRDMVGQPRPHLVVTLNAEMVMLANRDVLFQQILERADLVVPDGVGVVWASRVLGCPVPEKIPGVELAADLMADAETHGWRVFLLGGAGSVVQNAEKALLEKHPRLQIVGRQDGYFSRDEHGSVVDRIRQSRADLLLVALGVPRQEKWAAANLAKLEVPVAVGVGGTFDIWSGSSVRAPRWMQRAGLEWLFRLLREPRRIGRMAVLPQFAFWVLASWLWKGRGEA